MRAYDLHSDLRDLHKQVNDLVALVQQGESVRFRAMYRRAQRDRYVAAARIFDIENVMTAFRAPKEATVLPTKHRARACTYWKRSASS